MRILVTGASGYTGTRLVAALTAEGHSVRALVHTPARAPALRALGARVVVGDLRDPVSIAGIAANAEVIYHLVGTPSGGPEPMRRLMVGGTRNLLRECRLAGAGGLLAFIFTSSAAVYGDGRGAWVTEETCCRPHFPLGRCTLQVEEELRQARATDGLPAILLRLGAIYGPGRLPSEALRAGRLRLIGDGRNYSSRIHIDDLVSVLLALRHGAPRSLYCVADETPAPVADYYNLLAALLDAPPPGRVPVWYARARALPATVCGRRGRPSPTSADVVGLFTSDLRLESSRIRADLRLRLRFPSFREGLPASV